MHGKQDVSMAGNDYKLVRTLTRLYDKRMELCYRRIPIVRYTLVSSTFSEHGVDKILLSQ